MFSSNEVKFSNVIGREHIDLINLSFTPHFFLLVENRCA